MKHRAFATSLTSVFAASVTAFAYANSAQAQYVPEAEVSILVLHFEEEDDSSDVAVNTWPAVQLRGRLCSNLQQTEFCGGLSLLGTSEGEKDITFLGQDVKTTTQFARLGLEGSVRQNFSTGFHVDGLVGIGYGQLQASAEASSGGTSVSATESAGGLTTYVGLAPKFALTENMSFGVEGQLGRMFVDEGSGSYVAGGLSLGYRF